MKRFAGILTSTLMVATLSQLAACGGGTNVEGPVEALLASSKARMELATGSDVWEVVVCHVPVGVHDPIYADTDARLTRDAHQIARLLAPVTDYYERWSGGVYSPSFVAAAADVSIGPDETSQDCIDDAVAASDADGVLVVADAQHTENADGGRGGPGAVCSGDCPASRTGRYVYIGAADFMGVDDDPPLDLVEHELGHGLDWPHSSLTAESLTSVVYDSSYDVMSNSAAAREADPSLRHGPGVLVVDLLAVGWIDPDRVFEVGRSSATVTIAARSDLNGDRPVAIVFPIDDRSFVTIELVSATGDDAFQGSDFLIAHRVELVSESGIERRQFVVSGELRAGDEWFGDERSDAGMGVRVLSMSNGTARVEVSAGV